MGNDKVVIDDLSVAQLKALGQRIKQKILRESIDKKNDLVKQFEELAYQAGFTLDEVLQVRDKRTQPVKAKFIHPEDTTITWSGRGRAPKWVQDLEAHGVERKTFAVE